MLVHPEITPPDNFYHFRDTTKTFAVLASLVNTAKLNSVDPEAWLADVLERIISGKVTASQMDTLFPWTWKAHRESIADQERRAA